MSDDIEHIRPIERNELFSLPLEFLTVPSARARDLDPDWAEALAGLVRAQGLTNPITVRHMGDHYVLVTGLHRVAAFRLLGADEIPAQLSGAQTDDEARLEEVMENLGRNELNALDRCHHLFELKAVYERMYPETKAGLAGANARHGDANEMFSFAKNTADKIGLSERAIQIAVKIWSNLTPAVREQLRGTRIATKQSELKLLSVQNARLQQRIMDLIGQPRANIDTVQGALDNLQQGHVVSDIERKFSAFCKGFSVLETDLFDRLLDENEERIITSLKRRGRI